MYSVNVIDCYCFSPFKNQSQFTIIRNNKEQCTLTDETMVIRFCIAHTTFFVSIILLLKVEENCNLRMYEVYLKNKLCNSKATLAKQ